MKKLSLNGMLCGAAALSLVCAQHVQAGFTGMTYSKKHGSEGQQLSDGTLLWVTNIFAQFDNPNDRLLSVGFADVSIFQGGLYQNQFGGDTAPSSAIIGVFPDAAYDSFVTIGKKVDDGATALDGDWDAGLFAGGSFVSGGWFNSNPDNGQGDAGTYEDLAVMIAQLSIINPESFNMFLGDATIFWKDGDTGEVIATEVLIMKIPAPGALVLFGLAGVSGRGRRRCG